MLKCQQCVEHEKSFITSGTGATSGTTETFSRKMHVPNYSRNKCPMWISMRGSRKFSQGGGGGANSQKGSDGKFQHGKN